MAAVFWDDDGIVLLEFMPKGAAITGTPCAVSYTIMGRYIEGVE